MSKSTVTLETKKSDDGKEFYIKISAPVELSDEIVMKTLFHLGNKIANGKEDCKCKGESKNEQEKSTH
jgi:hypothetical protein